MKIDYGSGKTEFGPGVQIDLSGTDLYYAIFAYLTSKKVIISGPVTVKINEQLLTETTASIYVDPSGFVRRKSKEYSGRGSIKK